MKRKIQYNKIEFRLQRTEAKVLGLLFSLTLVFTGCKKFVDIQPPINTISAAKVFASDREANAAMVGVYSDMMNIYPFGFCSGAITIYGGMSADELISFDQSSSSEAAKFQANTLFAGSGIINSSFWTPAYQYIYSANAIIAGVSSSKGITDSAKNELVGEAEFVRAYCDFYLTNLFGDIAIVNSSNWNDTRLLSRSKSSSVVYPQIIADLKDAVSKLPDNYAVAGGEKIRPNKWAALALLARVYLYTTDYKDAEKTSSLIINSNLFNLEPDLKSVFLKNSNEAIWQLQPNPLAPPFNAVPEGDRLIPYSFPYQYLTPQLLSSFDASDKRKSVWIDTITYSGTLYYYPFKYTIGPLLENYGVAGPQYYMVLRLAEQYLIRSEARAQLNESNAVDDLNKIRNRAGLSNYTGSSLLSEIAQENRREFFCEWGHRWLDLKRTNQATAVLTAEKGFTVSTNDLLYPIPQYDLKTDPNLTQNSGY